MARAWAIVLLGSCVGVLVACSGRTQPPRQVSILVLTNPGQFDAARTRQRQLRTALRSRPKVRASVEVREARDDDNERADVAAALDAARPDLIVAGTLALARAAQLHDPAVPIVFEGGGDPVALCVVDSLQRPGRNATGVTNRVDQEPKMLERLVDAYPGLRRVEVLVDAFELSFVGCDAATQTELQGCDGDPEAVRQRTERLLRVADLADWGRQHGVEVAAVCVSRFVEVQRRAAAAPPDTGFVIPHHQLFLRHAAQLVATLAAARRPAIYPRDDYRPHGAMLILSPVIRNAPRGEVNALVNRILDGATPAELPVIMPTRLELVVNLPPSHPAALRPRPETALWADRIPP